MPSLELEHTFTGHKDKCWSISLHNKLPLLATASSDKTCRIYNLKAKQQIALLDDNAHTKTMRTVAFKPTGDFPSLAIGSFDSTVSIWGNDLNYEDLSETTQGEWELMAIIEGHENEIKSVDWSHDGSYLATCSRDKSIWIWEADEANEEFECVNVIQEHEQDVKFVKWHPYKNILASCSYDDTCRIFKQDEYDSDDWECVANLTGANGTIWACDFEKKEDGVVRLVNCSDDSIVRVWKSAGGSDGSGTGDGLPSTLKDEEEWTLESELPYVHKGAVYSVEWNKGGLIASCGSDGKIVIYQEKSDGKGWEILLVNDLSHGVYELNCLKWVSNSELVSAGDDGTVKLWKIKY
ncbi:unnamed protein product [Ambrosiozyma monospora]|uniref:Unnamed protein product n=1 Tax=Ambrosiozyma monospora TaxID=43982 RepID=A0ACB5T3I2_AMBMO|nr:unnamed protein product [Ambrosiozyma monospora]